MGKHLARSAARPWRHRAATAARHLALACDAAALLDHNGGAVELAAKCLAVALRITATALDRPAG